MATSLSLESYNDNTDCNRWLSRFEHYSTAMALADAQQTAAFAFHLSGRAADWYDSQPDATKKDLEALKKALVDNFKRTETSQLHDISAVWSAAQGHSESLPDFVNRVIKLAGNKILDNQLIFAATKGMLPHFKQYMVQREVKTTADLRRTTISAQEMQLITATQSDMEDLRAKVDYLTTVMKDVTAFTSQMVKEQPHRTQGGAQHSAQKRSNPPKGVCISYGEYGHFRSQFRFRDAVCHVCHKTGHIKKACLTAKRNFSK